MIEQWGLIAALVVAATGLCVFGCAGLFYLGSGRLVSPAHEGEWDNEGSK